MKVGNFHESDVYQEFPAQLEHLYAMLKFIKNEAQTSGFSNTIVSKIELAAEEALVNIINHGYPHGDGTILVVCNSKQQKGLRIILQDEGVEFNPLEAMKTFDPKKGETPLCDVDDQVGGYGIYFIVNMMDKVEYRREEGANVLTLFKRLP